jgi:hypothetical protein
LEFLYRFSRADAYKKRPYISHSEVEKAVKEMRVQKATANDEIPGDVLRLLGKGGLKLMTQLIHSIYVAGEWLRDSIDVAMTVLKKKTKSKQCGDQRTTSLITHTAKILARILSRRKTEDVQSNPVTITSVYATPRLQRHMFCGAN